MLLLCLITSIRLMAKLMSPLSCKQIQNTRTDSGNNENAASCPFYYYCRFYFLYENSLRKHQIIA